MPKRGAVALGLTAIALILLVNFQVPSDPAALEPSPRTGTTSTGGAISGSSGTSGGSATAGNDTTSGDAATDRTVDGPIVDTRFGPVQVSVTITDGAISDVAALELPTGGRSGQISGYAGPILQSEALQAQSASIDGVSGATYTSRAYAESLQSALDDAGYTG
jgi:uncharacterized protein with FMN-binding domain